MALIKLKNAVVETSYVKIAEVLKGMNNQWQLIIDFTDKTPHKILRYENEADAKADLDLILDNTGPKTSTVTMRR